MFDPLQKNPGGKAAAKTTTGLSAGLARMLGRIAMLLVALFAGQALAHSQQTAQIRFVNVADSTQGLSDFSQFPAINNRGAVVFTAVQSGAGQEVLRHDRNGLSPIALADGSTITLFTDDVAINDSGVVAFRAALSGIGRPAAIFISDGITTTTIVDSTKQGLPGFGIGPPSINSFGTVAFQAARSGFRSSAVFTGNGGVLTPVVDTLSSDFAAFGGVAINQSGEIVFEAVQKDRSSGIFLAIPNLEEEQPSATPSSGSVTIVDVVDSNNPDFFDFGDPVLNRGGTVADFADTAQGVEVFSGNGSGTKARTDPATNFFAEFEHPSINKHSAVAFSAFETNGAQAIFAELSGGSSPAPVLQTGDPLFGSTIASLSVGRFAFNDHFQLVFSYGLEDGRTGIALALLKNEE
ncbi:MAG TPA: choice-of-anchor tandem repeat NxxGxxAF-containing protein [Candidatus Angelobacter sp.]|nr:choice-of-anchor tandem repeat NxxGxxAF-containing protein [Candidatus Angelobacter sp.]